jgi:hypothetical protein
VNLKPVCVLIVELLISSSLAGTHQTLKQYRRDNPQPTAFAICSDVNPEPNKPVVIRGASMISGDGLRAAYAEVTVELPDANHKDEYDCRNRSTLFLVNVKNGQFKSVLDVAGADDSTRGSGFQLIDWSSDSELLLADLLTWNYGSEGWEHHVVLYSTRTGILKQQSLTAAFAKLWHTGCTFDGEVMGFLADGRIALREFRNTKDEVEEFTFCGGPNERYWALNTATFQVSKIDGTQQLELTGHFEQSK